MPLDVREPSRIFNFSFFLIFGEVYVFITAVPFTKLFVVGEGDSGGHVQQETTSLGLSGLVCPSHTSERGEGYCVKGGGGEGELEKERALGLPL